MPNPWLRLWVDMPNDPKWRTIAKVSKQSIPLVLSVYIHLLVIASNANERGRTQGLNCEDIASALDVEIDSVAQILIAMQGRVLDKDFVSGWEKRQPIREDSSADRAKEWRERKRTQANAEKRSEEIRGDEMREEKEMSREERTAKSPSPESLSKRVSDRTGIVSPYALKVLVSVCRRELNSGMPPELISEVLSEAWEDYLAAAPKLEYSSGAEKFFGEGKWKDKTTWPWKVGMEPKKQATTSALDAIRARNSAAESEVQRAN